MWNPSLPEWLLNFAYYGVMTITTTFFQSTLLISLGLYLVYALRNKGAAVQSVVLRAILTVVIFLPFVTSIIHVSGIRGVTFNIPLVSFKNSDALVPIKTNKYLIETVNKSIQANRYTQKQPDFDISGSKQNYSQENLSTENSSPYVLSPQNSRFLKDIKSSGNMVKNYNPGDILHHYNNNYVISRSWKDTQTQYTHKWAVLYTIISTIWIVFTLLLLIKSIAANLYIKYLYHTAFEAKQSSIKTCNEIAQEMGIKAPLVLYSLSVKSPILAGHFKPFILLPYNEHKNILENREIFVHELSHVKRSDFFWNQLRYIGKVLLPFQPLMWVLSNLIEENADYVCDDYVVKYTGNNTSYAKSLLSYSCHFQKISQEISPAIGFISNKSPLRRRIERILDRSHTLSLKASNRFIVAISTICLITTFLTGLVDFEGTHIVTNSIASDLMPDQEVSDHSLAELPITELYPQFPPDADKLKKDQTMITETENAFQSDTDNDKYDTIPGTATPPSHIESTPSEVKQLTDIAGNKNHSDGFATQSVKSERKESEDNLSDTSEETYSDLTSYADMDFKNSSDPENIPENFSMTSEYEEKAAFPVVTDPGEAANEGIGETGFFTEASNNGMPDISNYAFDIPTVQESKIKIPFPKQVHLTADHFAENIDIIIQREKKLSSIFHGLDRCENEPVLSPDGKWIAYTNFRSIWIFSSMGGEPKLIYDNIQKDWSFERVGSLCFTPDSCEIIFTKEICDNYRKILNDFMLYGENFPPYIIDNPIPTIESINIYTGEFKTIVKEGYNCTLSKSGRYLCYLNFDSKVYSKSSETDHLGLPVIYDMETSRTWYLTHDEEFIFGRPTFSPDESHIIVPVKKGILTRQLCRIPLQGGEPEQLTFYNKNESHGKYRLLPEYSPDGKWILYTDFTWAEHGPNKRLFLLYTPSGEIFELIKDAECPNSYGKWSQDGKQICYFTEKEDGNYIYIYDFDPTAYKSAGYTTSDDSEPERFKLYNNFPNPFNPSTTIKFYLPETGFVNLTIYNITGQKVRELVSEHMTAGDQTVIWDGRDDNGVRVSSGKYVSLLRMSEKSATGTMTLIK